MAETTLAELEKRVTELERVTEALRQTSTKDWRKVIGMFDGDEFMKRVDEQCLRSREAEREAARNAPET